MLEVVDKKYTVSKYLTFINKGKFAVGAKTNVYDVLNTSSGQKLGHIQWFWNWRKFVFVPVSDTLFEEVCLADISEFIVARTNELKATWKVRVAHPKGKKEYVYKVPVPKKQVVEANGG